MITVAFSFKSQGTDNSINLRYESLISTIDYRHKRTQVLLSWMSSYAGINFIHSHPPMDPLGFAPKICPHCGDFAS